MNNCNDIEESTLLYPSRDGTKQKIEVSYSKNLDKSKKHPLIIFIFGGGWTDGTPDHFKDQSIEFDRNDFITARIDYRVYNQDGTTIETAMTDAFYSLKYLDSVCDKIYADRNNVFLSGGSAGGHLALCSVLLNNIKNNLNVKGLILFNPVIDTTESGYMSAATTEQPLAPIMFSPIHHLKKGLPPTIIFDGTNDTTMPYKRVCEFCEESRKFGNDVTMVPYEGREHGFFNLFAKNIHKEEDFKDTVKRSLEFAKLHIK